MAQPISPDQPKRGGAGGQPTIIRGAEDQAAAYEGWQAQGTDVDPHEEEREWDIIKENLQQTRRDLGQRLLFPE